MNFVLKPTLEHMALVKIAISLWNNNDVRALISKLCQDDVYRKEEWKTIEESVIQKVTQLSSPHLLKQKVSGFIKPTGLQVFKWIRFHCRYLPVHLPAEFCWTAQGTIDRKRAAELLIKDDSLDMSTRYKIACIYCLEDDIIQFWISETEDLKESVSHRSPTINFWSRNMKRGVNAHISYKNEFRLSADQGNIVAAEYFLQKLTPRERKESLVETAKYVTDADTLCFLISKIDEEQQIKFFRHRPYWVLQCFLHWPWQSFFIEIASCMWDYLSKENYENILRDILRKVTDGYKDYNYQNLFGEFWLKSPNALKSFITNESDTSRLLSSLFDIKDKKNIKLILKDTTPTVKEKFMLSASIMKYFEYFICDNEWDFLKFCIRECLPSKNEMLKFKEYFEKHRMDPFFKQYFVTKKHIWDQLFCLSYDSICKHGKRSVEDGESSSSKQFQSLQLTHA